MTIWPGLDETTFAVRDWLTVAGLPKRVIWRAAPEDAGWFEELELVEDTRCIGRADVEAAAEGPALLNEEAPFVPLLLPALLMEERD